MNDSYQTAIVIVNPGSPLTGKYMISFLMMATVSTSIWELRFSNCFDAIGDYSIPWTIPLGCQNLRLMPFICRQFDNNVVFLGGSSGSIFTVKGAPIINNK